MVCEGGDLHVAIRNDPKENRVRKPRQINAANVVGLNPLARERPLHGDSN